MLNPSKALKYAAVITVVVLILVVGQTFLSISRVSRSSAGRGVYPAEQASPKPSPLVIKTLSTNASPQLKQLIESAIEQTKLTTGYDPAYVGIAYPGGDVPLETGVCSDVIVRAFRKTGIDLQKELHEDMGRAWSVYPRKWGASRPDANIDHRRVLNLTTWFDRQKKVLPVTTNRDDFVPGDIVTWDLGNGVDHIGMVVNMWSEASKGYLIVHNIGAGTRAEDVLLNWEITGHYRYFQK